MKNFVLEDLELPDWSDAKNFSAQISPEAAFQLCEEYYELFPEAVKTWQKSRPEKCVVEFVLD